MLLLLVTLAAALPEVEYPAAALPEVEYRYASFYAADPVAAGAFFRKYTGASVVTDPLLGSVTGIVDGNRLTYSGGSSDVYFVNEEDIEMPAKIFAGLTMAQDDWNWWTDWHLAFSVTDIDSVAARLFDDDVPFVNRGSLYFVIPGTSITIQVLGTPSIYWTEKFLFCRKTTDDTTGKFKPYKTNVSQYQVGDLPSFVPSHQSLAAWDADSCGDWLGKTLNVTEAGTDSEPGGSHEFANGVCANIRWLAVKSGWEVHFIEQYKKRDGGVDVKQAQEYIRQLNGNMSTTNAFHQFRVAFSTDDLQAYKDYFDTTNTAYYYEQSTTTGDRLRISAPNGYIFELFSGDAAFAKNKRLRANTIRNALHE